MYYYDGIIYRIWGVSGIMMLLGGICILLDRPWKRGFKLSECKVSILLITGACVLGLFYASRVCMPTVQYFEGVFVEEHRNSRVAPPLPLTNEYTFSDGSKPNPVFYLDVISKDSIFPYDFVEGIKYRVYYDELLHIIVRVEVLD